MNLIDAVQELNINCKILLIGSSEEYGNTSLNKMPLTEDSPNEKLVRPSDNLIIVGSNEKIQMGIGWSPKTTFQDSKKDILNYWGNKLSEDGKK